MGGAEAMMCSNSVCCRSHEVYMFLVILVVPGIIMGLSYIFIIKQIQASYSISLPQDITFNLLGTNFPNLK
jgi:ABC-type spermidine/putrescine transport system permease subunit II